jgi:hypothetical protein
LIESKKIIIFELEKTLSQTLKENFRDETKQEPVQITFTVNESGQIDKERLLKKWKQSEGSYYLNPEKFQFSLKNL